ncbi:MAG: hypothetical protein ACRD6B_11000 [Bryobacteraceae bacterium]
MKPLELYMRYHTAHDRAYQRASAALQKRKKARELAEIGFASQKRAEAEESRKILPWGQSFEAAAAFPGGAVARSFDPAAFGQNCTPQKTGA